MVIPKLSCDCPDFTKRQPANPAASPISEQINRDWSGMSGVANRGGYCKHIIRVLIELGLIEEWGIPTDMPTPGMWKPTTASDRPLMNPNSRLGDRFDDGIGFNG